MEAAGLEGVAGKEPLRLTNVRGPDHWKVASGAKARIFRRRFGTAEAVRFPRPLKKKEKPGVVPRRNL
jgi:hypothetical protein